MKKKEKIYIGLLVVIIIGGFFRFWQIDKIPLGLYPDEAINANEALTSPGRVFYPQNNGREGLFINIVSLFFHLFGPSILVFRIVPAIFGTLTILGLFLFTKELFFDHPRRDLISLLSSFLIGVSFWHVNFSRIGFRAILLPFFLVFSFYFLLKGIRLSSKENFLSKRTLLYLTTGGVFYGLGFYTYIPYRLSPLLFISFAFLLIKNREKILITKGIIIFLLIAFLTASPIGLYFLTHPQDFVSRASGISVFSQKNPVAAFVKSFFIHLGMFVLKGDQNWRHNHPEKTVILRILGIILYLALIFSMIRAIQYLRKKNWKQLFSITLILLWFFVMMLGGALSYEGIPHSLRTIGMIPVVFILIAWFLIEIYDSFQKKRIVRKCWAAFIIFIIIYSFTENFYWYFQKWAKNPNISGAFTYKFVEIGNYLNTLPDNIKKYVVVNEPGVPVPYPNGIPMPAQTVMFIERTKFRHLRSKYIKPKEINLIRHPSFVIIMKEDNNLINNILSLYPEISIIKNNPFVVLRIN